MQEKGVNNVMETLKVRVDAIDKRIDEFDARQIERISALRDTVFVEFKNAEKAIQKADFATEKRFESVNEFRNQLADQTKQFVNNSEYTASHKSVTDKIDILNSQMVAIDTTIRNKFPQVISSSSFLLGIASIIVVVIISIIGAAIQIGNIQTNVAVDSTAISRLVEAHRDFTNKSSKFEVDISLVASRQLNGLDRIQKLEIVIDKLEKQLQVVMQDQQLNTYTREKLTPLSQPRDH